jgi:hypothetical protein
MQINIFIITRKLITEQKETNIKIKNIITTMKVTKIL